MPEAETVQPSTAGVRPAAIAHAPRQARVTGWGGGAGASVSLLAPGDEAAFAAALAGGRGTLAGGPGATAGSTGALARGLGRSYGDAAQLEGGLVLETTGLRSLRLDRATGVLDAGAGVTLAAVLREAVPAGWILPVIPGTAQVTIGGAIASDVHGKNHLSAGTFAASVLALRLLGADRAVRELTAGEPLFDATCGGMGLTGVVLSARLQLAPVGGPLLSVDSDRVDDFEGACAALLARGGSHRVAWLDLLASRAGRGVVTRAAHLSGGPQENEAMVAAVSSDPRATIPAWWPGWVLRASTQRVFNEARFRRAPRRERGRPVSLAASMFPLDSLGAWPRMYGPSGLLQYQFAVPLGGERLLREVPELLRAAGVPVFLAVLKALGPSAPGPLSFPLPGWTLALDIPRAAPGLLDALDACDRIVVEAGGRVYLTKDARLGPAMLAAMYPQLDRWRQLRDGADPEGVWRSDLGLRTGLVGDRA